MRQIIAIGKSAFYTVFAGSAPQQSYVGGRIANAASSLAIAGLPVTMVSECADDAVGDIVVDFLKNNGVDVSSVDRYANGATPLTAIFSNADGTEKRVNYGVFPADRFDVMWPRINKDDIVIFGGLYAVENQQRKRFSEILQYAYDRKAILVYLPGFETRINYSITKVMPNILENLELADVVVATDADLNGIFPGEDSAKCHRNHMMYCQRFMSIDSGGNTTIYGRSGNDVAAAKSFAAKNLGWMSGYVAGLVFGMVEEGITHDGISAVEQASWQKVVATAYSFAAESASSCTNCIGSVWGKQMKQRLDAINQQ